MNLPRTRTGTSRILGFVIALSVGFIVLTSIAPYAHAQNEETGQGTWVSQNLTLIPRFVTRPITAIQETVQGWFSGTSLLSPEGQAAVANYQQLAQEEQKKNNLSWKERIVLTIGSWLISFTAFIAGIAGYLLDLALRLFVFEMGDFFREDSGIGGAVNNAWTVIRDVTNLFFIFGLLYAGFLIILDAGSNTARRLLPPILIGALFVNFSLFFTKAIIDVANGTAAAIYSQMNVTNDDGNIAYSFLEYTGLVNLYDTKSGAVSVQQCAANEVTCFPVFMVASVMFLIMAFVFAAGAVMITIRFVYLVFLMVLSPLLFGLMALPQMKSGAVKLWKTFLSQAFYGPLYLMFLWIAYVMTQGSPIGKTPSGNADLSIGAASRGSAEHMGAILNFILISMALIGSLIAAKFIGGAGAASTVKFGSKIGSSVGKYSKRAAFFPARLAGAGGAAATRKGLGGVGRKITTSKTMEKWARQGGKRSVVAGAAMIAGENLQKTKVRGKSYEQAQKDKEKRRERIAKLLDKEDESVYESTPDEIQAVRKTYKDTQEELKRKYTELANTTDASTERIIQEEIFGLEDVINKIEKPKDGSKNKALYDRYNAVRKQAENSYRLQYAAALDQREEEFSAHPMGWLGYKLAGSPRANKEGAKTIRKSLKRSDADKIVDAVRTSASSGTSTP